MSVILRVNLLFFIYSFTDEVFLMTPQSPVLPVAQQDEEKILTGSLIVEEFDWKSIETKLPMLRLVTTGVKGAVMELDNR